MAECVNPHLYALIAGEPSGDTSVKMEDLAVMGITEVLLKLFKILKIRKRAVADLIEAKPCVFIGIDLPDFNLYVEAKVKKAGIPTVHYVSPSVWAWRENRVKKIKEACDEILALLPFEPE